VPRIRPPVLCALENGAATSIVNTIGIKRNEELRNDSVRPLQTSALMNSPLITKN